MPPTMSSLLCSHQPKLGCGNLYVPAIPVLAEVGYHQPPEREAWQCPGGRSCRLLVLRGSQRWDPQTQPFKSFRGYLDSCCSARKRARIKDLWCNFSVCMLVIYVLHVYCYSCTIAGNLGWFSTYQAGCSLQGSL